MHAVRLEVAGHVRAGQPEFARRGGEIGGAARGQQVQPEVGVLGPGGAAVVRGELQRQSAAGGEDLQDLGERQLSAPAHSSACSLYVVIVFAPPSHIGRGDVNRGRMLFLTVL